MKKKKMYIRNTIKKDVSESLDWKYALTSYATCNKVKSHASSGDIFIGSQSHQVIEFHPGVNLRGKHFILQMRDVSLQNLRYFLEIGGEIYLPLRRLFPEVFNMATFFLSLKNRCIPGFSTELGGTLENTQYIPALNSPLYQASYMLRKAIILQLLQNFFTGLQSNINGADNPNLCTFHGRVLRHCLFNYLLSLRQIHMWLTVIKLISK